MKFLISLFLTLRLVSFLAFSLPYYFIKPGSYQAKHLEEMTKHNNDCTLCHLPFKGVPSSKCIDCHKNFQVNSIGPSIIALSPIEKLHTKFKTQNCTACHIEHLNERKQNKLSFEHGLLKESELRQCSACHEKPRDSLHKKVQKDCSSCHNSSSWQTTKFDHDRYFVFDRHHPADCNKCHVDNKAKDPFSSYTCYGCHEHSEARIASEHREEGIYEFDDCAKCHQSGKEHGVRKEGRTSENGPKGNRQGWHDKDRDE